MAVQKTIEIIFAGTDKLSSVTGSIGSSIEDIGGSLQDIGQPFADATKLVFALDAAIAGLAVAGITASSNIESSAAKMTASLGLTNEEAGKFEDIAKDVYKSGVTSELTAAFEAVTLAQQKLGDNAEVDIGKVSTAAIQVSKTWDEDVNGILAAASVLMDDFGLSSDDAFNFIAAGFQKGLNGSGDFLDSVTEYAPQFQSGGADAGEFFSILETGFSEGVLGTDKAADAFGEFRKRIQDDSTKTSDALESIGIDPDEFAAKMASGELSAIDAFNTIQAKINETTDVTKKQNAAVDLLGTQFEDMGNTAGYGLDTTKTKVQDLEGAMDKVSEASETFEKTMLAAFNTITTEFGDLSEWKTAKTKIAAVFTDVADSFGVAIEDMNFDELEVAAGEVWDKVAAIFSDTDLDITSVEGMKNALELTKDTVESILNVTSGLVDIFDPIVKTAIDMAESFNSLDSYTKTLIGQVLGLGTGLATLGGVLAVGGTFLSGIASLSVLFSPAGALAVGLGAVAALVLDSKSHFEAAEQAEKDYQQSTQDLIDNLEGLPEEVKSEILLSIENEEFEKTSELIANVTDEDWEASINVDADPEPIETIDLGLKELPEETIAEITAAINDGDFDKVDQLLQGYTDDDVVVDVKPEVDDPSKQAATQELSVMVQDPVTGKDNMITIEVPVDTESVDKAKDKIDEIPSEKLMEIKLQGEIDKEIESIKTQAETIQTAMEWTAKVDIAKAESAAKTVQTAMETTSDSVVALSDSFSSMFTAAVSGWDDLDMGDQWDFMDLMEAQLDNENKMVDSQIALNKAQTDLMDAKTKAYQRGDGAIKIDGTGLTPALEMVMWEIIELVQIRASAEQADFLLGI